MHQAGQGQGQQGAGRGHRQQQDDHRTGGQQHGLSMAARRRVG